MHLNLLRNYLALLEHQGQPAVSRRTVLTMGAAAGSLALGGLGQPAAASQATPRSRPSRRRHDDFDDTFFDYADPANFADWVPSIYGAGDQRGAFNEVTPDKTADAMKVLQGGRGRGVRTFQLGELMTNGFPGYVTSPPRTYDQRLTLFGYTPPDDFVSRGGIFQGPTPLGRNRIHAHEERFGCELTPGFNEPFSTTYQIGTSLDNLNHAGAGGFFYNGFRGPDIAEWWGTNALGNEHMGPIVTRGVLLDVLGLKLKVDDSVIEPAANGKPVLAPNYRITIEDIQEAMRLGGIEEIEPGDVVLIRTGWNQFLDRSRGAFDPAELQRWGAAAGMPGIYLAEARWLATMRPAIVGSDTWALEVLGSDANEPDVVFPVHQELLMRHGIRIVESAVLDALADAGVHEYVFIVTPQFAAGATAANAPPAALAVPHRRTGSRWSAR
ncbi:MAG: cyclase family protein [Acidimicrobiales bacterium]